LDSWAYNSQLRSLWSLLEARICLESGPFPSYSDIRTLASLPNAISALTMFAAYAIHAKFTGGPPLTTVQAFTSLALLSLLSRPASNLLYSSAKVFLIKGSVDRIQEFLDASFENERRAMGVYRDSIENAPVDTETHHHSTVVTASKIVLKPFVDSIDNLSQAISFKSAASMTTVIIGPVGSGKSSLLQSILGELEPAAGTIIVSAKNIGYCAQTSWIQNCSIRNNIIGPSHYDEAWYNHVTWVCDLDVDFARMRSGDLTETGGGGSTLSGGQKHRVVCFHSLVLSCFTEIMQALARALYSRSPLLVLDDLFSSLDRHTRDVVTERLLGRNGHAVQYGCAVIIATHSRMHFCPLLITVLTFIVSIVQYASSLIVLGKSSSLEFIGPPADYSGALQSIVKNTDDEGRDDQASNVKKNDLVVASFDDVVPELEETSQNLESEQTSEVVVWKYYLGKVGYTPFLVAMLMTMVSNLMVAFESEPACNLDKFVFNTNIYVELWLKCNTDGPTINVGIFVGIYAFVAKFGCINIDKVDVECCCAKVSRSTSRSFG
jgi:ATP-binding cassette subfamily C (CFTR/MRP) protein 1